MAADGLLFRGASARTVWHWPSPGAVLGNPVGDNEGHELQENFWGSVADIPRRSMVWLNIKWLPRHKLKHVGNPLS